MDRIIGAAHQLATLLDDPQNKRLLTLDFPRKDGPDGALMLANRLHANEAMSRDFRFEVEVISDDAHIPLKRMMAKMVTVSLVREDGSLRHFNGYVIEFRLLRTDGGFAFYEMVLGPWLSFLHLRRDSLSFLGKTLVELTQETFERYPERDWRSALSGNYAPLTCVNQFNESDHNHLHRRWEEHGLHYWYEHRADGHTLCLGDNTLMATPIDATAGDAPEEIPFRSEAGSLEDDSIAQWRAVRRIAPGSTTLGSFDYKAPRAATASRESSNRQGDLAPHEVFEYAGAYGFRDLDAGESLAQRRMEELDARAQFFEAEGNDRTAQPGRSFRLGGHYSGEASLLSRDVADRDYLIVETDHVASNNFHTGAGSTSSYRNTLLCLRKSIPWRPGRGYCSVTPTVAGVQTAIVVGPPGAEIHTDEYGRVKLQFHWDRIGKFDDKSSAWVRVMTGWAGNHFGQICLPRVGQEVVVQFLDGNVDKPIVIGSVYNKQNMPPWELPANKTQSGMLTRSSKEGGPANANALRFEDSKGAEEVWLHAEKDQRIEVENDESHSVGHDRKKTVGHDETVEVKNDRREAVGHDEDIKIGNDRSESVGNDERIDIGNDRTTDVGGSDQLTVHRNQHERVVLAKEESIGLGKALSIGGVYQTTVGGAMNTTVAMSQSEQVGMAKMVKVGGSSSLTAETEHRVNVGGSQIIITPTRIELIADEIAIKGRKKVEAHGNDVDVNPG